MPGGIAFLYPRAPDRTPAERERTRYMRLTTAFTLLLLIFTILITPWSFINVTNPATPIVTAIALLAVIVAVIFNRLGLNIAAASMIIASTTAGVMGTMIINPVDPSLIPVFGTLVVPVIMAGALMPPVAALIDGSVNCVLIVLTVTLQKHTPAYDAMIRLGLASVSIVLPLILQIIVAIVIYVIMRNLFHHRTGTPVDPLLAEINYLSRQASQRSQTSVPPHPLA